MPATNTLLHKPLEDLAKGKIYLDQKREVQPTREGRAVASWRRMLLSQPPASRVELNVFFGYEGYLWPSAQVREAIVVPEGVRVADIIERLETLQEQKKARGTMWTEVMWAKFIRMGRS